jgi:signal transduction histidine kinase
MGTVEVTNLSSLPASLHRVDELEQRPARAPELELERAAIDRLIDVLEQAPEALLDALVQAACSVCHAGTAGVSLLEDRESGKVFRWAALAGRYASALDMELPRAAAMCQHVIDLDAQLLAVDPAGDFAYLRGVDPPVVECLLVPFRLNGAPVGTLWVVHHEARRFDREDVRLLTRLGRFASIAFRVYQSMEALKAADRRKDEFLAVLSHELRNPLAPIRNAAQILGNPRLEPQQLAQAQGIIDRQVTQLAGLLDDLLDLARSTQGKLQLRRQRVELTTVVDAAVEVARPIIDRKSHELTVQLPDVEMIALDADALRASQIVSNLLTNAAKYTKPGGHIELSASVDGEMLRVSVADDGIGIPPHALERIFSMFAQGEGAGEHSEGGLGIGLALTKRLVELHGGTIEARSAGVGCGSTFSVRLPLARASSPRSTPSHDLPAAAAAGGRLLIADDNRDAADSLAVLLGLSGHVVRVAYGGRAAVALAQAFRPEVAIIDLAMPELDGYSVAQQLRQEPWGRGIRLVALSARGREEDKRRAHAAGFEAHLTKPVDPDKLNILLRARLTGC